MPFSSYLLPFLQIPLLSSFLRALPPLDECKDDHGEGSTRQKQISLSHSLGDFIITGLVFETLINNTPLPFDLFSGKHAKAPQREQEVFLLS